MPGGKHATVLTAYDIPGRSDVPHAGTSEWTHAHIPAGRTDVPLSDVPHAGTSIRRRTTNTEEKTGKQPARRGGIPDRLEPLRTALATAGLGAVAWDIRKVTDWERIRRQMDRLGIDVMVRCAANAARSMGEPASVTAWISRWESLADPQPEPAPGVLPAAVGQVVQLNAPGHRPSTTDARVQQALEVGRRLQAQADAARTRQEQP